MMRTRGNISFLNFDSVVILLILLFGVLIFNNSDRNVAYHNRKPVSNFVSASENTAVLGTFLRVQVFQKTWISNKDNFDILAFNRNPLSEDKKATIKYSYLQIIRQNSHKIPQFLLLYHLFPQETEEPPQLS